MSETEAIKHASVEVVDLQAQVGEYVHCKELSSYNVFGEAVEAFTYEHACRLVISRKWNCRCQCCNAPLRWAFVVETPEGYTLRGRKCLAIDQMGTVGARKWELQPHVKHKQGKGYCMTFRCPPEYWNARPSECPRPWKGKDGWYMTAWADTVDGCLSKVLAVETLFGRVK